MTIEQETISLTSSSNATFSPSKSYYPVATGHRGFKGRFPENTLAGFDAAAEAGVEVLELDLQVSSDGLIVVSHDLNTKRCFGADYVITKTPYKDVMDRLVNKRSVDNQDSNPDTGMPLFLDVAKRLVHDKRYSTTRIFIDIKAMNSPSIIGKLIQDLRTAKNDNFDEFWVPKVVLGIWKLDMLKATQQDAGQFKVIHIGISRSLADKFLENPQVVGVSLHYLALTAGSSADQFLLKTKKRGALIYSWTVNTDRWLKWAIASDLDGVVSDFPDKFLKMRSELAKARENGEKMPTPHELVPWWQRNVLNVIVYGIAQVLVYVYFSRMKAQDSKKAQN